MKAIWSGAIAFGLVNIPVKLYAAVTDSRLDFDMLDKKDLSNIKYKRVNEQTGREVAWSNIVKGYDLDGKYVVLTDQDFEKASPEKTKLITLELFVDAAEIDIILYNSAYYMGAAKGGERAFALLEEALRKSGKCGVGTFVLRNREHPVIIRSAGGVLILHTLHFLREIRDPSEFMIKKTKTGVKRNELTMANSLVKSMTGKFDIKAYKDAYTQKLMKFIKAKATGKKLPAPKKVLQEPASDLIEQLKKSIAGKKKKG